MSDDLRDAIRKNQPHLKSSVDDLESLYWVALWAMVFNIYQPSDVDWQSLLKGSKADRGDVSRQLTGYLGSQHSALVLQFVPFLRSWTSRLNDLRDDWKRLLARSRTIPLHKGNFWPFHYHKFAYRGVADVLEVVTEHKNRLSQFPSFVRPLAAPSASSDPSSTKQTQPPLFSRPHDGADDLPQSLSTKRKRNEDDQPESGKKQKSVQ